MKKFIVSLMLVLSAGTTMYAGNSVKSDDHETASLTSVLQNLKQKVLNAPSGTTYGVTQSRNGNIVVTSPLGKHTIERCSDGSYSFMGMKAKLVSVKNGAYTLKTSVGTWVINTRKGTVTKK